MTSSATRHWRLDEAERLVGNEVGVSDWISFSEQDIVAFGQLTRDLDPMHIDPEWARKNSPYGAPIVFGFQLLSMLTYFLHEVLPWPAEVKYGLNYGFERVRFLSPVRAGVRVRTRVRVLALSDMDAQTTKLRTGNIMEIEGEDKPALTADWIGLLVKNDDYRP